MAESKQLELVLRGTTAYFEHFVPEVAKRLESGELVFLNNILSGGCPYNCLKCFSGGASGYSEQLNVRGVTPISLTKSEKERLVMEAYENGVRGIIIGGAGEPFLSPDLDQIVKICSDIEDLQLIVFTTGLPLDKRRIEEYFSKGISIMFSLDSTSERTYDKLTRSSGNLGKVLDNLEIALTLSEKYLVSNNGYGIVPLAINTNPTLLTYNPNEGINEIEKIHTLINRRAAHFVFHPTPNGNAIQSWKQIVGTDDFSPNPMLKEAEKRYANGLGGSSRKKDKTCAYIYNGVAHFEGYWMMCPNFGTTSNLSRYPEKGLEQHFREKKDILDKMGRPACITREKTSK